MHSGAVAMQLRSYGDALLCFDRALALSSACVPALLNRAMCYHRMGNMQRAEEDYSTVISISPVRRCSTELFSRRSHVIRVTRAHNVPTYFRDAVRYIALLCSLSHMD